MSSRGPTQEFEPFHQTITSVNHVYYKLTRVPGVSRGIKKREL